MIGIIWVVLCKGLIYMKIKQRILITGGAGNIGSSLVRSLILDKHNFVVVVDDLSTGSIDNLPSENIDNYDFVKCNVNRKSEIKSVMSSTKFDVVFHYAAVVGVERTQRYPLKVLEDIEGIKNILNLSLKTGVKKVFYASSSEVYGEPVHIPQNEITTPLNSRVPYAIVKNVGESFFKSYGKKYGMNYTIFRFFNTYGERQNNDFVIPKFLDQALRDEDICIYGDGSQSRTFLHINDNIEFTLKVLKNGGFTNGTVNVGNSYEITIIELANIIIELLKSKSKIKHIPPLKEGDMRRRVPDITEMLKFYNKDLIEIRDGINLLINDRKDKI